VRKREALSRTMEPPSFEMAAFETAACRGLLKMRPEQDDFASTRRPCETQGPPSKKLSL